MSSETNREEIEQCRKCTDEITRETHCLDCWQCHICCRCGAGEG